MPISANHLTRIARNREFCSLMLRDFQNASRASVCISPILFEDSELFDKNVIERFNNTKESFVFNYVREAIHYYIVMGMARIWDAGKGPDILSIPKYIKFLKGAEIRQAWATAQAHGVEMTDLKIGNSIPDKNSREFAEFDQILSNIEKIVNEKSFIEVRKRLTRWRNEQGAHSLDKQLVDDHLDQGEKRSEWGDFELLIDRANKALSEAARLFDRSFVDHQENYGSYAPIATRYWQLASATPR